jgi:hypothetical protein
VEGWNNANKTHSNMMNSWTLSCLQKSDFSNCQKLEKDQDSDKLKEISGSCDVLMSLRWMAWTSKETILNDWQGGGFGKLEEQEWYFLN